jgi:hypothetical protein
MGMGISLHAHIWLARCYQPMLMKQAWPQAEHRAHGCEQTRPGSIVIRGGARHDLEAHACFLSCLQAAHSVL